MPKLQVNQPFPPLLRRIDYALISVVDSDGRVKTLKLNPSKEHADWLRPEWQRGEGGRVIKLISVDLTSEREASGCFFLKHAYEDEKWLDGWKVFEDYNRDQFMIETTDANGNAVLRRRQKSKSTEPFPDALLPKRVLEARAKASGRAQSAKWKPPEGIAHPDDAKEHAFRAKVEDDKARLRKEIDAAAKVK